MIDDLDEALRRLLVRELPIKSGEVDIAFDQPKRDWSARLSRPALNLFLFDIRENQKLRQAQRMWQAEHQDGQGVTQRRQAVRLDLRYFITAWATEPEDEHRLLARTLAALFLYPTLPDDLLPEGLLGQPAPIQLLVAQEANLAAPSDLWGVMDNELRPAIVCVVTMGLNPYQPVHTPLVRTRELPRGPFRPPVGTGAVASGPARYLLDDWWPVAQREFDDGRASDAYRTGAGCRAPVRWPVHGRPTAGRTVHPGSIH